MKVMKTRKRLPYQQLIAEITEAVRAQFTTQPKQMKQAIESLLETEYLTRDAK